MFCITVQLQLFSLRSVAADDTALQPRSRQVTKTQVHYGYHRVFVMLRGRTGRIITNAFIDTTASRCLKRPRRNKSAQRLLPQPQGLYPNHVWGMNFVSNALFDGTRLRLLTVIDLFAWGFAWARICAELKLRRCLLFCTEMLFLASFLCQLLALCQCS